MFIGVNMRGGKREGSGRKKKPDAKRITFSIVCSESEKQAIELAAEKENLSKSQFIMLHIKPFLN